MIGPDAASAILAGALGGVVRWATLRTNWKEGVVAIIVGAICAVYLGPLIEPLLEPIFGSIAPDGDAHGLTGFICGIGGITLAGVILDVINRRKTDEKDG